MYLEMFYVENLRRIVIGRYLNRRRGII